MDYSRALTAASISTVRGGGMAKSCGPYIVSRSAIAVAEAEGAKTNSKEDPASGELRPITCFLREVNAAWNGLKEDPAGATEYSC